MPPHASIALPHRTLKAPAQIAGVSLFLGVQSSVTVHAAPPGSGISFSRTDLVGSAPIPAVVGSILPETRRTLLSLNPLDKSAPAVHTVEHLMSALAALGITDARADVSAPELPIGDGSAKVFWDALLHAGIHQSPPTSLKPIVVRAPIVIEDRGARIEAHPTQRYGLELEYQLEYPPGAGLPRQSADAFVPLGAPIDNYADQIAPARTFSLLQEAQAARAAGLFKHIEPKDSLVIGPNGPIDNTYRFPNEPARHKLLDMIGDLALAARPIQARIVGIRSGHALNHAMAKSLVALQT